MLQMFLTKNSWVEDLLCGGTSCSSVCLFFSDDLLRLRLQSVQYDHQYDFAWVADEADLSIVLALLQIAFLGLLGTGLHAVSCGGFFETLN